MTDKAKIMAEIQAKYPATETEVVRFTVDALAPIIERLVIERIEWEANLLPRAKADVVTEMIDRMRGDDA